MFVSIIEHSSVMTAVNSEDEKGGETNKHIQ
jgi:hypothetical protein